MCCVLSAYVEASAAQLFPALGLELLILYLPGSNGLGLAPGFCFGSGKMAEILGRKALATGHENIVSQVFISGEPATSGRPPEEALGVDFEVEFWSPGRVLALPLKNKYSPEALGVLLFLRNLKTAPFNDEERRLLKLYCSLLGARLG
ncbi:MAG: GAF domain-containing protein [Deltaproteobacteria bacterium]|nr:GAF domain-containing protein [Candidatus Tharpella sp.]